MTIGISDNDVQLKITQINATLQTDISAVNTQLATDIENLKYNAEKRISDLEIVAGRSKENEIAQATVVMQREAAAQMQQVQGMR